jgi:hypothetical protein
MSTVVTQMRDLIGDDNLFHGFGKYDDLGVFDADMYDRNRKRADANNQQACSHCGRGLNLDTCSLAIYTHRQRFISVNVDYDKLTALRDGNGRFLWEWVFLGSECAKNLPADFRLLYRDFSQSKWADTPAHHDADWGTW